MQRKRLGKVLAVGTIAIVASLSLAACSSSKSSGNKSGGLGGGSKSGGANAGKTFTIGFEGDLSSKNDALGINEINAVDLAVKQANDKNDLGFKLQVLRSDDAGDPNKAPAAAQKLIQDSTVVGVIGPIYSGPTAAVGKTYADAGMGLISPSATNEALTKSGFTTFHRVVPTDGVEGKATADWLATKAKKVFVIDDTTTYGKGVADVVRAELKAKGIKVVSQSAAQGTSDYGNLAQTVVSAKPDAMYYGGYYADGGRLARALKTQGYKGLEMSGNGAKDPTFVKDAGVPASAGYYFACGCLDATSASAPPAAQAFNTAYKAAYNTPSGTYSPEAFDATNGLIQAIKTAAGQGTINRQTVEAGINGLDYQGITTTVKFASNGEVAQATVNLYQVKNGAIALDGDITKQ